MTALTSLESLLRISTLGSRGDLDAGDGVHVSVSLNPALGAPLHPFVCGVLEPDVVFDVPVDFLDPRGNRVFPPFAIEDHGAVDVVIHGHPDAPDEPWCWIWVLVDGPAVVEALDTVGPGRPFARRGEPPYSFGASAIRRLRLSGNGIVRNVMGFPAFLGIELAARFEWHRPFGLPIFDAPWYAGGQGEGPALDRVAAGAPSRLGPPDEPLGPGTAITPAAEVDRVQALHPSIHPWIDTAFFGPTVPDQAILDTTTPPNSLVVPHADPVPRTTRSSTPCVQALTVQAGDPGLARYLGLATVLPVEPPRGDRPLLVVVGAFFGIHRSRRVGPWRLRDVIPADTHLSQVLADQAAREFALDAVQEKYRSPREIRFLPLIAGVAATPDRPDAPDLSAPPGRWRPRRLGESESWHQQLLLHGAPPAGPVALARLAPGAGTSLHRVNSGRAVALFAGRLPKSTPATTWLLERPSTVSDPVVPSDPTGGNWQVAQADRFGRWSAPATVSGPLPPRPAPRPPVVHTHIRTAALDRADTSPRSPADLRLSVQVPVAAALEAGALPLASLELSVDGVISVHDVTAALEVVDIAPVSSTLPAASVSSTLPAASVDVTVSATFVDTAGVRSAPAVSVVTVHDPRPLPVVKTGPALLWTGRRDATGSSELALTWPAANPDAAYRVYLSTSDRLAPGLTRSLRSDVAGAIWEARATLSDRSDFSLVTDPPLHPVDGVVSLRHTVPGSLRGVAFVRIVPVSKGNVEADFAHCGLIPITVPHSETPPAPTVRAHATDDGAVTVTVSAAGLSPAVLAGTAPGSAPEVRLRRARTMTTDPLYVPVVATTTLTENAGTWSATVLDTPPGGLAEYQRVTYWAEIRYPAELALPPDVVPIPVDGGATTPPGIPTGDLPSPWGPLSLPATTVRIPADVPTLTGLLTFTRDEAADTISGTLPVTTGFHLQLWSETAGTLTELPPLTPTPTFTHTEPLPVPAPDRYHALLTDPLGRPGPLTPVEPA